MNVLPKTHVKSDIWMIYEVLSIIWYNDGISQQTLNKFEKNDMAKGR